MTIEKLIVNVGAMEKDKAAARRWWLHLNVVRICLLRVRHTAQVGAVDVRWVWQMQWQGQEQG